MKNEKGITIIALIITVIVLAIIATISISTGRQVLMEATVQTIETNMLAIKAKAKAYAEEIEAATWALKSESEVQNSGEETKEGAKKNLFEAKEMQLIARGNYWSNSSKIANELNKEVNIVDEWGQQLSYSITDLSNCEVYMITTSGLKEMGLDGISEDGEIEYLVVYDADDFNNMDVIYMHGISYQDDFYYTLSKLQNLHNQE